MKSRAQWNIRDVAGFDVMLLHPVKIQANVILHIKITMRGPRVTARGLYAKQFGSRGKKTVGANGITVNFFNFLDITSGGSNVPADKLIDEIIFSEI